MEKRVLLVSDSPYLNTGFSGLGEGIGQYLYDNQFIVKHIGLFDPRHDTKQTNFNNKSIPWPVYSGGHPNAFKKPYYDDIIKSFSPDLIIVITDIWLAEPYLQTSVPTIFYVHIEGEPLPDVIQMNNRSVSCLKVLLSADKLVLGGPFARYVIQDRFRKSFRSLNLTKEQQNKMDENLNTIIPDGCRIDKFIPLKNKQYLRSQLWYRYIDSNAFVVGYFGRQNPRKGLPYAIEAFAKWHKPNTYLYLHTALKDSAGWNVQALIKDYNIQDKVITNPELQVGKGVPIEKLNQLYNACDITVCSSSGEGFGGTVCFLKNTYVRTKHTYKPIQWIKPGDHVYTHEGHLKKVVKIYKRLYHGLVFRIYTDVSSIPICVTTKHPLLSEKWKNSGSFKKGDALYYPIIQTSDKEKDFVIKQLHLNTHYPKLIWRNTNLDVILKMKDILLSLNIYSKISRYAFKYQLNIYQNIPLNISKKEIDYAKTFVTQKRQTIEDVLVYNLEVKDDHSYLVNGVVAAKNCDSLATETPAIITDYSELKNFTKGTMKVKPAAFYVEPRTNIRRAIPSIPDIINCFDILYNDKGLIKKLGKEGREDVAKYDWKNIGPKWGTIVNNMISKKQRSKKDISKARDPVSIIILNKDKYNLITNCITHIMRNTTYPYDIIIVDNGSTDPETIQYLKQLIQNPKIKVYQQPGEFNFSRLCNFGARQSKNSILCFLNNDAFMQPNWLSAMVEQIQKPQVGIVGAKLLFQDSRIQHAGINVDDQLDCKHAYIGQPSNCSESNNVREVQAVTGAALLTRRDLFNQVGQFDEQYKIESQDVDFCFKIRELGYKIMYTPYASGIHITCATRGPVGDGQLLNDRRRFKEKWKNKPGKLIKENKLIKISKHNSREPLVSIIIPTYNCSKYLPDLIENISNQTYKRHETIIIDDGSTDDTINVLRKLSADGYKFAAFKINKHSNANIARMEGYKKIRGKYLLFSDADSKWEPQMLEKMVKVLQDDSKISYAYSDYKREGMINDIFKTIDFKADYLKQSNYISMMSLVRKKDFPGLDLTIERAQDWDLWLTMLENDKIGKHIPEPLFLAYVREGGTTGGSTMSWTKAVDIVKNKHGLIKKVYKKKNTIADVEIVIAMKNLGRRGYDRLYNNLYSLAIQTVRPKRVLVMDGSDIAEFNEVDKYIKQFDFVQHVLHPLDVFNKPLLYNLAIKKSETKYMLMTDADYIYEQDFLEVVMDILYQDPNLFILCRTTNLPEHLEITEGLIKSGYMKMKDNGKLHKIPTGDGACQASLTAWFQKVQGYDERLVRLGGMDNDMHYRAERDNLKVVWVHDKTSILHQWHKPTKWATPIDIEQMRKNRQIVLNDKSVIRNINSW